MSSAKRVVLAQPPFFRVVGSHNNRGPLELAYLAQWLSSDSVECVVGNLDASPARVHCSWRNLFERSDLMQHAVYGRSPVLYEAAEWIVGQRPDAVVLSVGDSLTPWVDLGNSAIAARLAEILRPLGFPLVAVGPRTADWQQGEQRLFDAVVAGWESFDEALPALGLGELGPLDPTAMIPIVNDASDSHYDVVMTSLGCVKRCTFCDAGRQTYREIAAATVARDVAQRARPHLDIGDAIFLPRPARLTDLRRALDETPAAATTYSSELSVEQATPAGLARLVEYGVTEVKIGVESADALSLDAMNKRHTPSEVVRACERVRAAGLRLCVYVLLGGPIPNSAGAAARTLELCQQLPADDFVINVWAYSRPGAQPTDSHFSGHLVDEYGLGEIMASFFALQADHKPTIGQIVDLRAA